MFFLRPDPMQWLEARLGSIPTSNAAEFWYDEMASQSGYGLPLIYEPFDGAKRAHFCDRGAILDFALTAGPGRVLDFGPGDGWPALMLAARVEAVVGVDASRRRVEVCRENAMRLGVTNAWFVRVSPQGPLPFADATFDGVTGASSVEQTPNPQATLRELYRVLKPGGRLRLSYESLGRYRQSAEHELAWAGAGERGSRLLLFERHIEAAYVRHLGLILDLSPAEMMELVGCHKASQYGELTPQGLALLLKHVIGAAMWTTQHPTCPTWLHWLHGAGFRNAVATESGARAAGHLYDGLAANERPREMAAVDALLEPKVRAALKCVIDGTPWDDRMEPPITAVK